MYEAIRNSNKERKKERKSGRTEKKCTYWNIKSKGRLSVKLCIF